MVGSPFWSMEEPENQALTGLELNKSELILFHVKSRRKMDVIGQRSSESAIESIRRYITRF